MRRLALSTIVLLAGCGGDVAPAPPGPPGVIVATPTVRTVTEYYHYNGITASAEVVDVRARVLGELQAILYTPATRVEAGTPLFRIDSQAYEIARDAAAADADRANAALQIAQLTLQRVQSVFEREAATELEKLEAEAVVKQREAEFRAARARLADADRELGYTTVTAPITGRVSRAFVDAGNLVGVGEPTVLTQVARMDPIWVYFDVSERIVLEYLGRGKRGDVGDDPDTPAVEIALANTPEGQYPYHGVINWVDNRVDEATGTIRVRAEIPNAEDASGEPPLFPGLFVRARVPRQVLEDALLVPEDAIVTGLDGKTLLIAGEGNIVEQRAVTLGPRDGAMRVVTEGVSAGDRVIVAGAQKARPGLPVAPTTAEPGGS